MNTLACIAGTEIGLVMVGMALGASAVMVLVVRYVAGLNGNEETGGE